ncbi:hypothetical protein AX17_002801 [Amanita inopinata Kibby_2008]|nr:hypothetical protein AX17_002801 [Amanita inopinata Kibby_2008]
MTDLDVATAQLIIRLVRDDIYGLDPGDASDAGASLSDVEYALAMQEQEFMQHWLAYGGAQFEPGQGGNQGASGSSGGVSQPNPRSPSPSSSSYASERGNENENGDEDESEDENEVEILYGPDTSL